MVAAPRGFPRACGPWDGPGLLGLALTPGGCDTAPPCRRGASAPQTPGLDPALPHQVDLIRVPAPEPGEAGAWRGRGQREDGGPVAQ